MMGGYAPYVWTAFGVVGVVLIGNMVVPYWQYRVLLQTLKKEII